MFLPPFRPPGRDLLGDVARRDRTAMLRQCCDEMTVRRDPARSGDAAIRRFSGSHPDAGAANDHSPARLNTSVALVPPKPKEFDSTVSIFAPSMRLRTIGMSAKAGSISSMLALSQMKPSCIIRSE